MKFTIFCAYCGLSEEQIKLEKELGVIRCSHNTVRLSEKAIETIVQTWLRDN